MPLLERLNFISIFWSNLQEFFMVRVGSLTDLSLVKKHIIDSKSGMTPAEQLDAVYERCHELYPAYERTYESLRSLLQEADVSHLRPTIWTTSSAPSCATMWTQTCCPSFRRRSSTPATPFPHLENGALYLVVRLDEEADAPAARTRAPVQEGAPRARARPRRAARTRPTSKPTRARPKRRPPSRPRPRRT